MGNKEMEEKMEKKIAVQRARQLQEMEEVDEEFEYEQDWEEVNYAEEVKFVEEYNSKFSANESKKDLGNESVKSQSVPVELAVGMDTDSKISEKSPDNVD